MKNTRRLFEIITVVAFLAIILCPLLFIKNEPGRVSAIENKTAASKPVIADYENVWDKAFVSDLEAYLSDNIGFKEEAILAHVCAMYKLFGISSITNFVIGKENHTFYLPDSVLQIYQGRDQVSQEEIEDIRHLFIRLDQSAKNLGSRFIFMPIPNKEAIYGEYMPDGINTIDEMPMFEQVTEDLLKNTDLMVVDTKKALLAHEGDGELLYYRNSDASHWNHYGMFWGYLELMETIKAADPELQYLARDDMFIDRTETHTPFLYLTQYESIQKTFGQMSDYAYNVVPKTGWHGVCMELTAEEKRLFGENSNFYHYCNDNALNDETLLIVGDSYIYTFMLPLLSENFKEVYFISHASIAQELQLNIAPDYVLFESVSRMVNVDLLKLLVRSITTNLEKAGLRSFEKRINELSVRFDSQHAIHFDNVSMEAERRVDLSEITVNDRIIISGWTIDFAKDEPVAAKAVYLQVGDSIIASSKMERPDIEDVSAAGYYFDIPKDVFDGQFSFTVYAVSDNGESMFMPQVIEILR